MCSNCGFPSSLGHWTEAGAATAHDRIRARFHRAALLRGVLAPYALTAHDDGTTPGIALSDRTGRVEIVEDLAALWPAAERLGGRPIDPLDPRYTAPEV
jgi:hypothetical protein